MGGREGERAGAAECGSPHSQSKAARPPKPRSLWWRVHGWAGLKLSILLTFVFATGTLAVFAHEIDWLATPAMRVTPRDGPQAGWGALAAAAARVEPGGQLRAIYAPTDPWFAAEAWVGRAGASAKSAPRRVYLDPWTGEVTGTHGWANAHRFLRQTHRHLMLPARYGIPLVSSLSLLLLASLVTGIVTYKKWWRGFFRLPRRGLKGDGGRRLAGDLHRLGGVWSLWFVALIGLTGLWYLVESLGGAAPQPPVPKIVSTMPPPTGAALDRLAAIARRARPTLTIREIRFTPDNGVLFLGQDAAWLVRDRANGVAVDPRDGRVLANLDGRDLSAHQRISEMADPLHFGTWGGLPARIAWFLFGAVLTGLAVTGVIVSARRLQRADAEGRGGARAAFAGMGAWGYVATALVILAFVLTPGAIGGAS